MRLSAFLGLALAITACSDSETLSPQQSTLESARDTFETNLPSAYTFQISRSCECTAEFAAPMRVEVIDGEISSVVYVETNAAVAQNLWPKTIEQVFEQIEDALDGSAAALEVTYDTELGYPAELFIDYDIRLADEELSLSISQVQPLAIAQH